MNQLNSRPFKIWNGDRKVKKSAVVTSLQELKSKGAEKLGLKEEGLRICLEEDGTLIEDEDYLATVKDHTVLLLLEKSEQYKKSWQLGHDETDFVLAAGSHSKLDSIASCLRHDFTKLITLKDGELQLLVDADTEDLGPRLQCSLSETEQIQEACQRYLDERMNAKEAIEAVKLLTRANSQQKQTGADTG